MWGFNWIAFGGCVFIIFLDGKKNANRWSAQLWAGLLCWWAVRNLVMQEQVDSLMCLLSARFHTN